MHRHTKLWIALALAAAVGCGPGSATPVIPSLPGDGDEHTAKPREPKKDESGETDPWDGRDLIAEPAPIDPRRLELPGVQRFTLRNGLEVLVVERRELPVVSMQLAVRVGRADAGRDKMGIERLVAQLLPAGTRKRSADKIRSELEQNAVSLNVQASYENTLLSCHARAEMSKTCLSILPDLVANPTFPKQAIDETKSELAQAASQLHQDPAQLAALHFQNLMWGDDHVRGWPMTPRTIEAISRGDIVKWHRAWFRPQNAVLAIAGDVDAKALKKQLEASFRIWRKGGKLPKRASYEPATRDRVAARLIDWPGQETAHIRVGHQGLRHKDPDFFSAAVFNEVLGGSRNSRLDSALRSETKGRALGGSSGFDRNFDVGIYVVSAAAPAGDALAAVRTILQQMGQLASKPISDQELSRAVTRLAGGYAVGLETASQIGNAYLAAALHDLGNDYVRDFPVELGKVTPESAMKAAKRILDPVNPAIVIVGDASKIAPQLQAIGVTFETVRYSDPIGRWERAPEPDDSKEAEAKAKKILAKALEAKGGAAKLKSIKTMILEGEAKGVIHDPSAGKATFDAKVRRTFVAPNRMRRDIERDANGQKAVSGIILDGDEAWAFERVGNKQGAGELPPALVRALKTQMWRDQELVLLRGQEAGTRAVALPDRKVDGNAVYAVRLTSAEGISTTLYIDKKTHLLHGQTYSEQGSSATERYGDYKDVAGIKVAHRRITSEGSTRFDMTIKKIQFNVDVSDKLFNKPK